MISLELFEISLVFEKSRPQTTKNLTVRLKRAESPKALSPGRCPYCKYGMANFTRQYPPPMSQQ